MTPAELRRQYRAARVIARQPEQERRLADRYARAASTLAPILGPDPVDVPGFRVWRDDAGTLHAQHVNAADAAQLALWQQITQERNA